MLIGEAGGYNEPILGQGLSVTLRDARIGGLGTSNGRIVSFLASLNSVAGFRRQKRAVGADGDSDNKSGCRAVDDVSDNEVWLPSRLSTLGFE